MTYDQPKPRAGHIACYARWERDEGTEHYRLREVRYMPASKAREAAAMPEAPPPMDRPPSRRAGRQADLFA